MAKDADWRRTVCSQRGHMLVLYNAASLRSRAMANQLEFYGCADRDWIAEQTDAALAEKRGSMLGEQRWDWETFTRQHVAERDAADETERERLREEHRFLDRFRHGVLVAHFTGDHGPLDQFLAEPRREEPEPQELSEPPPAPLDNTNPDLKPPPARLDNTKPALKVLAALARRLITENDPDAIRAGLREIADALDARAGSDPLDATTSVASIPRRKAA
jgi:hypothetical protein